jgi:hypothetical protein
MASSKGVDEMAFLDIDTELLDACFGRQSFAVRHSLAGHPLLTAEAIESLADRLPAEWVRRESGELAYEDRGYVEVGRGRPSETIRTIADISTRVSLREIQQDVVYAPFVRACHDEIEPRIGSREGGLCGWSGYVFVTSPGSTTPMHLDPEHSFLLQIRGTKRIFVAGLCDADLLVEQVANYVDGRECDFDALRAASQEIVLEPGDGVYFPSFVPHWVYTTGNETSVSFSLPFYTRFGDRAAYVHRFNKRLRALGRSPRPPGVSAPVDMVKAFTLRSWTGLRGTTKLPLPSA